MPDHPSRRPPKRVHLAAQLPSVQHTTVWSDPRSGSQIAFDSFERLARTAERGKFDFFFLSEGLRLREHKGRLHDLDVVGRPESLTVLSALSAVTSRIGLAATVNSTFNEPYEVARRLATLDHLSGGRAAWNVVTSWDAFTGENFRRGGFLDEADRYTRAAEFLHAARALWDSWRPGDVRADAAGGTFTRADAGRFSYRGRHFDIAGRFATPRPPQGHPVVIQAGDSPQGREFAAADADVIFSRHSDLAGGRAFYRDVKGRLAKYGRTPDELKIIPSVTYALGDTPAEAAEHAAEIARAQVGPQTALMLLEALWGRDLSGYDPDGPLPDVEPLPDAVVTRGHTQFRAGRAETVRRWRESAEARGLSIRELAIEFAGRPDFVGTPRQVADAINEFVQTDAADGFIFVPHLTPGGLDDLVDRVVPLLQEMGVHRADYTGPTLRDHLGLNAPREPREPGGPREPREPRVLRADSLQEETP
ncbi:MULTISPECIES: NtaA/DmoA family FMN-dependent monooxygenase [Kitasatospora]|uniref:Putative FMNH2-dependent monooxygenase n=1 Tax=Kitasatospora setae (strain ATCC 33774 / DSM 43861 / JCM 3304 / KCC A-0304 / NBRC 14216 / KM-6054) TaxID=452652 RepID=E4N5V9_KITSK|nr:MULTISPECIES: NtaA/DmoA family FMN-dependent monooxygenase [Kitasatospora]BAJ26590.1 putative FMNH2-dependent monooxygenase [Kitasatospora setae KM-6054]